MLTATSVLLFLLPLSQISPDDPDLPHDGFTLNAEPNHPTCNQSTGYHQENRFAQAVLRIKINQLACDVQDKKDDAGKQKSTYAQRYPQGDAD
ncbi:MAG: hypothetical protein D3910_28875 [Candidatus Electrothrix sp. ATG2]|nr:hypothetical protein [Candidatus Electrothrix sp. ATG2]